MSYNTFEAQNFVATFREDSEIARVSRLLTSTCDGPLTEFVLISRATRLASQGEADPQHIAEALAEVLGIE